MSSTHRALGDCIGCLGPDSIFLLKPGTLSRSALGVKCITG